MNNSVFCSECGQAVGDSLSNPCPWCEVAETRARLDAVIKDVQLTIHICDELLKGPITAEHKRAAEDHREIAVGILKIAKGESDG